MRLKPLLQLRYWLEIVALPIFVFLVIHLAGEGFWSLLEGAHEHVSLHEEESFRESLLEFFWSKEVLVGVLLCLLFIRLWRKTFLKKWVPCAHEHCHHEVNKVPHVLAILVLCVHFFPEAGIRYSLLTEVQGGGFLNVLGVIGFLAHFLVDIIVMIFLSLYWKSRASSVISFFMIFFCWVVALLIGDQVISFFPESIEGGILLVGAFFLAMFIHMPHKPIASCKACK